MPQTANIIQKLQSGDTTTIIAIGDSLTYGWMTVKGYVDFLNEMIKDKYPASAATIINQGIPGDTAQGGLSRLEPDVIRHSPDLTIIQFALNDFFMGHPVTKYSNNIQAIIENVQMNTSSDILLVTSVPLEHQEERRQSLLFYDALRELSRQFSTLFAEVHTYWDTKITAGTNRDVLVQADRVHPTVEGYRLMAEAIIEVL